MKISKAIFSFVLIPVFLSCYYNHDEKNTKVENNDIANTNAKDEGEKYKLVQAFPKLEFSDPVELTSPDDGTDRIFVLEQKGVIRTFANKADVAKSTIFLNISRKVESGGEMGLLGLAFHPDYKNNGYFYVNYTRGNPLTTVIARYKANTSNPNVADPNSETILLTYRQPYENHNGGKLAFGNEGFLYIAAGDGGSGGDPGNRAQNRKELLGKILRIDVNKKSGNLNYAIPGDNPFRNSSEGYRPEIYAYGMRNPWRFSFDRQTGALWCGDVGQNRVEEVDIIEKGANCGWHIMEGDECFKAESCNNAGLTLPIWSYRQGSKTGNSVTGGYVCRDKSLPGLNGKYVYGDFVSGNVWALSYNGKKAEKNDLIANLSGGLSSFGEGMNHDLFLLAYGPGKIYKFAVAQ
jgi:glucose/arabinose dehydrogenase